MTNTTALKRERGARRQLVDGRLVATEANLHGTPATYANWMCRCRPCTAAHSERVMARRLRRGDKREMVDGRLVAVHAEEHGTYSTYINWMCRCEPCIEANRVYQRPR